MSREAKWRGPTCGRPALRTYLMKPRFEPESESVPGEVLIDPEAYESSEEKFAASLDAPSPTKSRFVVEEQTGSLPPGASDVSPGAINTTGAGSSASSESTADEANSGAWRQEVAARVSKYRSRRQPRPPRYPSLRLNFDAEERASKSPGPAAAAFISNGTAAALKALEPLPSPQTAAQPDVNPVTAIPQTGATILEFPRSASTPPVRVDELAEPVFDHLRILEVPELLPPPPALGGILIESAEKPAIERRPGFELPLQSAPLGRRLLASGADALVLLIAVTLFAYIFLRIDNVVPPLQTAAIAFFAVSAVFWLLYQYLLLGHAGATPGMKLARLQLCRFDGSPAPRTLRRWRVTASVLSGVSLMLGYAWCFLDEDRLCWHDRITRTYLSPPATEPDPQTQA